MTVSLDDLRAWLALHDLDINDIAHIAITADPTRRPGGIAMVVTRYAKNAEGKRFIGGTEPTPLELLGIAAMQRSAERALVPFIDDAEERGHAARSVTHAALSGISEGLGHQPAKETNYVPIVTLGVPA